MQMYRHALSLLLVAGGVLIGGNLHAQQPAPPNADAIPEKMPFSTPYGAPIGAERAQSLIQAFEDAVQKADLKYILSLDDVIASRGGIPLIEDGRTIGAIGCSGGTGSQERATCTAAAALVNK
jgi:uncharacterized protein GlcG (DUF336 family)